MVIDSLVATRVHSLDIEISCGQRHIRYQTGPPNEGQFGVNLLLANVDIACDADMNYIRHRQPPNNANRVVLHLAFLSMCQSYLYTHYVRHPITSARRA